MFCEIINQTNSIPWVKAYFASSVGFGLIMALFLAWSVWLQERLASGKNTQAMFAIRLEAIATRVVEGLAIRLEANACGYCRRRIRTCSL